MIERSDSLDAARGSSMCVGFGVLCGPLTEAPSFSQTPLHLAAAGGHADIANWLVDIMGCDKGAVTAGGSSAAAMARTAGTRMW